MIKRYKQFITEANESNTEISQEIKDNLKEMIEKTIEKSGGDFNSFVEKFIKEPENTKIEGLINDSDIFDFYLKWRNDVDPILNDIKFYDQSPTKIGKLGLYEYVVAGTQRAIEEVVKGLTGSEGNQAQEVNSQAQSPEA
jgi:hypothetical protein